MSSPGCSFKGSLSKLATGSAGVAFGPFCEMVILELSGGGEVQDVVGGGMTCH